jgi:uncharacterized membrane protein
MNTPYWALSLAYWLHMLATVIWIGGLCALALLVLPAAHRALDSSAYAGLLAAIQKRLNPLAWLSLLILLATGMFQLSANSNYQGFLAIDNRWSLVMLVKHITFLFMVLTSAYLTWGLLPKIQRAALKKARGIGSPESTLLQQREQAIINLNLILGVLILAFTALARAV